MPKKFYITTPVYYVNDVPHIGHAYTSIAADTINRYYQQKIGQKNTFFLTGTDEHGAKIAKAAGFKNLSPKEYCDQLVPRFKETWKKLNISYDYFIRTSNRKHEKIVQKILDKIHKKGDIYKKEYKGLYCVDCERMLQKSDLAGGKCPDHKKAPKIISEENYFFKLSKYAKKLKKLIEKNEIKILPEKRKNEIISKIKLGLQDISISRQEVTWGIPLSWDQDQTIYVWIDALLNYYSGPILSPKHDEGWFPADLHLMAKDILWFHAVIWPAICLSAGLKLPKSIFAHGFFKINGQKMSKTIGNVIDPNIWVEKYGVDAVRYYLLTAFPFGEDGDVSEEELVKKYHGNLANELGNLVNRVAVLIQKHLKKDSKIKSHISQIAEEISLKLDLQKIDNLVINYKLNEAIEEIWKVVKKANEFKKRVGRNMTYSEMREMWG
jgi:methionyl-tRNA synthetase